MRSVCIKVCDSGFVITTHQRSCGKVMFSVMSLCPEPGVPIDRAPPPGPVRTSAPLYRVPAPTASNIWWPRLETCSNLFTWGRPPNQFWHLVAEECTVSKRAVRILLECFLVNFEMCARPPPLKQCKLNFESQLIPGWKALLMDPSLIPDYFLV